MSDSGLLWREVGWQAQGCPGGDGAEQLRHRAVQAVGTVRNE